MHAGKIQHEARDELLPASAPGRLRGMLTGFRRRLRPPPAMTAGVRLYAIGDVHGRLDLLDALLAAIRVDSDSRGPVDAVEIVLLGDLIDRGPESAGVVRRAMAPLDWATLHTLLGNHEQAMTEALAGDTAMARMWIDHGGEETLRSWGVGEDVIGGGTFRQLMDAARAAIPLVERLWLARLPLAIRRGDYHFVHAGVRPGVALADQSPRDALWIRDPFLSSRRDHGAMIVHGHSIAYAVDERSNRIGIDTGAYATGRLTALALEGTRRWTLQT